MGRPTLVLRVCCSVIMVGGVWIRRLRRYCCFWSCRRIARRSSINWKYLLMAGLCGVPIFSKALCLGAKSVGIGRGFLYALNYGSEGVEKYVEILKDELETTMRMMGVNGLSRVHPGMLNTGAVDHLIPGGAEHPYAKWRPKARI